MTIVEKALALRAFEQGFAEGADPLRKRKSHTVDPTTHEHWRRGFAAGRESVELACERYGAELGPHAPGGG